MDATGAIRAGRPLSAASGRRLTLRRRCHGTYRFLPLRACFCLHLVLLTTPPIRLRVKLGLELVVGVETPAVVPIVLHEAEVDRHLAHRAGHSLRPPLCGGSAPSPGALDPRSLSPPFAGMTIFSAVVRLAWRRYPSRGRTPSTALPTRTCVAPAVTASSRSALIPADTMVAAGCAARRSVEISISRSKAAPGAPRTPRPAARPSSLRPAAALGRRPPPPRAPRRRRAPPRRGRPAVLTRRQARPGPGSPAPAPARTAAAESAVTSRTRSTECTKSA